MRALIIGANSGIGLAFTKYILNKSPRNEIIAISLHDYNLRKLGYANLKIIKCDLNKNIPDIEEIEIDLIINCIGIAVYKPFKDLTENEIDQVIKINLKIPILIIQKYLVNLIIGKAGRTFIQIGSLAGFDKGHKFFSIYSATKMALVGLINSLSVEYEEIGVHFLLIAPKAFYSNISKKSIGGKELQNKMKNEELETPENIVSNVMDHLDIILKKGETVYKVL